MSIGSTNGGALFNAVQMPRRRALSAGRSGARLGNPGNRGFARAQHRRGRSQISRLRGRFQSAISAPGAEARLSPARQPSNRARRRRRLLLPRGGRWYARAHAKNLDRERTWTLVRALITETDVDLILIDHSIQRLLEEHARSIGEDPTWLDSVFRGVPGKLPPVIRHAEGHATHLHVRFFNPIAQETGRRMLELMVRKQLVEPPDQPRASQGRKTAKPSACSRASTAPRCGRFSAPMACARRRSAPTRCT